ncbi:hypothetical protein DVK85_03625 [Flavobacterium arcticum]|uniref:LamG domain-containing protein n=1 Tax=Flavobacterium arcticum TaxID=1784713 RepID=A0A345H9V8_9FLAO|nr:LamG-like jellyroll fold domain-containing protein [Flavobacterium arcticum]AXG73368.1 hypothetical protein DVK85_03625 [Flavobacterium arcticum]KAF2513160.1 LamG domain-containing protein [Flavobacterium arcticum]
MRTIKFFAYSLMITSGVLLTSCGSDDDGAAQLPPIGGYSSADEVGADDLLAYFPLNGNGEESISGTMPSNTVGTTYAAAIKGQGAMMINGYIDYPSIANINPQSGSFTVSCWALMNNTKATPESDGLISPLVSFSGGASVVGNLSVFGNTHGLITSDSIQMKAQYGFKNPEGDEFGGDCINMLKMETWMVDDNNNGAQPQHAAFANKIGGQWAHVVFSWEGTTGTARMFVNGVKISNPAWEVRNNGLPMPLAFFTPSHPTLGALATYIDGTNTDVWNKPLTGGLDEVRIWDKMLSTSDINALYELELAGR